MIKEKLIQLIADKADVKPEEITDSTLFADDLGFDSLDMVELVMDTERELQVKVPDECYKAETVSEFLSKIESKVSQNCHPETSRQY